MIKFPSLNKPKYLLIFYLVIMFPSSSQAQKIDFKRVDETIRQHKNNIEKVNFIFQVIDSSYITYQDDSVLRYATLAKSILEKEIKNNKENSKLKLLKSKLAYTYYYFGKYYFNFPIQNGNNDLVSKYCETAIKIASNLNDNIILGKSYDLLGLIYQTKNSKEALRLYKLSNTHFKNASNLEGQAKANERIAGLLTSLKTESALDYYLEASQLYKKLNNKLKLAGNYSKLGFEYSARKNNKLTEKYFLSAIESYNEVPDSAQAGYVYSALGHHYIENGDALKAIEQFNKNYAIQCLYGNNETMVSSLQGIYIAYNKINNKEKAINAVKKQLFHCKNVHDSCGISKALFTISIFEFGKAKASKEINKSQLELIKIDLLSALKHKHALNNKSNFPSTFITIGAFYPFFSEIIDSVITTSFEKNIKYYESEILKALGMVYQELSMFDSANYYLSASIAQKDSLIESIDNNILFSNRVTQKKSRAEMAIEIQNDQIIKKEETISNYTIFLTILSLTLLALVISMSLGYRTNRKLNKAIKTIQETQEKLIHQEQLSFEEKLAKQKAEQEMNLLRAQMNPHFIFNALNSIHNCILQKDTQTAASSLTKFSRLIRRILESTRQAVVSLENEISNLELYIQLEQMRFSNKFNYKISIDPEIDINQLNIPPLLLQPFVENSIWHGLMPSKNIGEILIDIKKREDHLHIIISDNGIGRKRASEIKNKEHNEHTSHGISITKDRLNVFNNQSMNSESFTIIDLYNDEGVPTGTQVEFDLVIQKDAA